MELYRGKLRRGDVCREVWEVQGRSRRKDKKKGKASAAKQGGIGKSLRSIRGVEGRNRNETSVYGPMDYAKTLKLRFREGDLDRPERGKRYTRSREEEEIYTQMCPCGKTRESRTRIVGECEIHKEERDVLEEETREIDVCAMEEFDTIASSEKTIAILGDRW